MKYYIISTLSYKVTSYEISVKDTEIHLESIIVWKILSLTKLQ